MDKDFAYLIGAYLGDGHIQYSKNDRGSSHQFTITSSDEDFCSQCSEICKRLVDKAGSIKKVNNYYKLVVCSKELCDMVLDETCWTSDRYEADHIAKKSILPNITDYVAQQSLVIGLMDADGWIRETVNGKYMKYEIGFKNTAMWSPDVYKVIEGIGVKCSKFNLAKGGKYHKSIYSWTMNPKDYAKNLGFRIERKKRMLDEYLKNRKQNTTKRDKSVIIRLTEKEKKTLDRGSVLSGRNISEILREGAWLHLGSLDADKVLERYQQSNENERSEIVEIIFRYHRQRGYPHAQLKDSQLIREMQKLCSTKSPELPDGHLQSNTVGLMLANYFHPHMIKVRCLDRYLSPYELYANDEKFRDAIKRRLDLGQKANDSGIRRILRTRDGVRSVVNFKPAIAKFVYDTYCRKNGRVLDPCAGYGGRLAGCIASNKGIHYHGIDPHGETAVGNMRMAAFFREKWQVERTFDFEFKFDLGCAEEIMPCLAQDSYDLIFTSPPYFDVEKYSMNPDQSYRKFDTYETWRQGFLKQIIKNSAIMCKPQGRVVLNVKNYKDMRIADDVLKLTSSVGLNLKKTHHMRLPNLEYNRRDGEPTFHTEPLFVFGFGSSEDDARTH